MTGQTYRADIDGLRAVAVLLVILFHTGLALPGGFIGVDIFFVISGYLITGNILQELRRGEFSLASYWIRRFRRIGPAQLLMSLVVLAAGAVLLMPDEFRTLGEALQAQMLLGSNFFFRDNFGYFDGPAELHPLLHTWSLAVEEQFYLIFPLLLMFCHRLGGHWTIGMMSGLAVISFIVSVISSTTAPSSAFFLLPSRAWELLLGGLVSRIPVTFFSKTILRIPVPQDFALAVILLTACFYHQGTAFPGWAAIPPCLASAVLVFCPPDSRSLTSRILQNRWLVRTGLISYSLYLWHWPVIVFLRYVCGLDLTIQQVASALGLTLCLAIVSYQYVEQPIRRRQLCTNTRRLILAAACIAVSVFISGRIIKKQAGIPSRIDSSVVRLADQSRLDLQYISKGTPDLEKSDLPSLGDSADRSRKPDFLVWGDSHAVAVAPALDQLARKYGLSGRVASRSGIIPLVGPVIARKSADNADMQEWNQCILEYARRQKIENVILVSRWCIYGEKLTNGKTKLLVTDEDSSELSVEESRRVIDRGLARTIASLREAGANVYILKPIPDQMHDPCREYLTMARYGLLTLRPGISHASYQNRQSWVTGLLNSYGGSDEVTLLDPVPYCFADDRRSRTGAGGMPFYSDPGHLSPVGAKVLLEPLFDPVLLKISAQFANSSSSPFHLTSDRSVSDGQPAGTDGQQTAAKHRVISNE